MAKKETPATVAERTYNIPLRKEYQKAPRWMRTKKAVIAARQFLARHMKTELPKVKLGKEVNEELWKHGIKNPPHHVKVTATKDSGGIVKAELFGKKKEKETKKEGKKSKGEKEIKEGAKEVRSSEQAKNQ